MCFRFLDYCNITVAGIYSGGSTCVVKFGMRTPNPIFFIFIEFSRNFGQIIGLRPFRFDLNRSARKNNTPWSLFIATSLHLDKTGEHA